MIDNCLIKLSLESTEIVLLLNRENNYDKMFLRECF